MNENLKQLMLEAGYAAPELAERAIKLAKLIILDCIDCCDEEKEEYREFRKSAWSFEDKNIYAEGEAACDTIKYKMKRWFDIKND